MTRLSGTRCTRLVFTMLVLGFTFGAFTASHAADRYIFEDQNVVEGATDVAIPIKVETDDARHALAFSIRVGDKLTLKAFDLTGTQAEGALWSGGLIDGNDLIWGMVLGFSQANETFDDSSVIPAGTSIVANLIVDVAGVDGDTTTVEFLDDLPGFDVEGGTKNRMTTAGVAFSPELVPATISIGPSVVPAGFRRGDVTGDGMLDVSDPIANLAHQFLGTFEPICLDAHDFNDSGEVDISDPIANLSFQFIGGDSPPPPAPGHLICGPDPTPDSVGDLGCEAYPQDKC